MCHSMTALYIFNKHVLVCFTKEPCTCFLLQSQVLIASSDCVIALETCSSLDPVPLLTLDMYWNVSRSFTAQCSCFKQEQQDRQKTLCVLSNYWSVHFFPFSAYSIAIEERRILERKKEMKPGPNDTEPPVFFEIKDGGGKIHFKMMPLFSHF